MTPSFCAICTNDSNALVQRPLGSNDALVWICPDCDTVHPRTGRYAFDDSSAARGGVGVVGESDGHHRMSADAVRGRGRSALGDGGGR